jgi:hypothetical protein
MAQRAEAYIAGSLRRSREQCEGICRNTELLEKVMVDYRKDIVPELIRILDQAEHVPDSLRVTDAKSILHFAVNAKAHVACHRCALRDID